MNKSLASVMSSVISERALGFCLVKYLGRKRIALAAVAAALPLFASTAQASSWTWNSTTNGADWSTTSNWTPTPPAGGPSAAGDTVTINTNISATNTITLFQTGDAGTAAKTVGVLNIGDADTTNTFNIAAGTGGGSLVLNNNGAGAQINELSTAKGDTISAAVSIADAGGLAVSNASANGFFMSGGITGTGNLTINANAGAITIATNVVNNAGTITNSGTGAGSTTISGGIGSNVTAITQNSGTSALLITGTLTVNSGGTTLSSSTSRVTTASGVVNGTGNLILNANSTGTINLTNTVNNAGSITASGSGTAPTIISGAIGSNVTSITDTANGTFQLTGSNIANVGNITFSGTGGSVTLGTGTINTVGSILNNGTTTGATTISGALGSTVTGLTENSATSALVLSGNNTNFGGNITVTSGTLSLGSATALGGNGSATGAGGTVSLAAGTALNASTTTTITTVNAESWNGDLTFVGSNNLDLGTGAITIAGPLTVTTTSKMLTVDGTVSGGNGIFDIAKAGTGTLVFSHDIALGSSKSFNNITAGTETLAGTVSGSGFGLTMNSAGTLALSGTNTYSGPTTVSNGTLTLIGSGSVASSAIKVDGSTLNFNDTAVGSTGATRAASVNLINGGILNVTAAGNTTSNTIDTITGALSIGNGGSGGSFVTLTPNTTTTPENTLLTAGSFSRSAGSVVLFRGTNLGVNSIASQTAGSVNVSFGTAPTLTGGGGAVGSTTHGIIKGAYGDITTAGTRGGTGGLVTYDTTNGVRLLTPGEYTSAITDGQTQLDDVLYSSTVATGTLNTNLSAPTTTINSLSLVETGSQTLQAINITGDPGTTLKINSGVIYASNSMSSANTTAGVQLISVPTLDLNGQEGVIIDGQVVGTSNGFFSGGLRINSVITDANGLTIGGAGYTLLGAANTYTGTTTYNGTGRLILGVANAIPGDMVINSGGVVGAASNSMTGGSGGTNLTINGGTLTGQNGNSGSASAFSLASYTINGGTYSAGSGGHGGGMTIAGVANFNGGTSGLAQTSNMTVGGLATFAGGVLNISTSGSATSYTSTTKFNGGLTIVNTASGAYTPINLGAGTVSTLGAEIVLTGNLTFTGNATNANTVTISAPTGSVTPTGVVALNGSNTFNIGDGAAAVDLTVAAPIINGASAGALVKTGAGTLLLSGSTASTYDGGTTVSGGTLILANGATLGDTNMAPFIGSIGLTVDGNSTTDLGGSTQIIDSFLADGPATVQNGSISSSGIYGDTSYAVTNTTGTVAISANLLDSSTGGAAPNILNKTGAGTLILSGSNGYTGVTTLSAGRTVVASGGSLAAGSTVNVGDGSAVVTLAGSGTINGPVNTTTVGANVAHVAPGDSAATVGTLHLGNQGLTVGNGTQFDFDINTSTLAGGTSNDEIAMAGGTLNLGSSIVFNFNQLSSLTTGSTYTLIDDSAGTIAGFLAGNFSATGIGSDTATFSVSGNQLLVSFSAPGGANTYFYTGGTSTDFTDFHNYNTSATGGTQQTAGLSSASDVTIGTTTPAPTNITPVVNSATSINTLTFASSGAGATLSGTGTVTLAASGGTGITDNAGGTLTETISAPVALGSNQNWSVTNGGNTLTQSGGISGAHSLSLSGNGTFNFASGNSTYSGGTTVNSGAKLLITNTTGTSALGTGALVVQKGAAFGGSGNASGLASFAIGSGGSGTAAVQVGAGGTDTTSSLTLVASGASTIASANLTFNLNTAVAGEGNQLNVGATGLTLGSGVTLTLNLVGANVITANTPYVLVAGIGGNNDGTLAGSQYAGGSLTSAGTDAFGHTILQGVSLAFTGNAPPNWYNNSYLFLVNNGGVDDIEVMVVPEPSTWAMIIGGLGVLLFWQRRRRNNV